MSLLQRLRSLYDTTGLSDTARRILDAEELRGARGANYARYVFAMLFLVPLIANARVTRSEDRSASGLRGNRLEYTVIGDAVNTASRIESLCKKLSAEFIISEQVFEEAGDLVRTKPPVKVKVKGKEEALRLHVVLGPAF